MTPGDFSMVRIVPVVTTGHEFFFWPVPTIANDRPSQWTLTAISAANVAKGGWIRLVAQTSAGKYETFAPQAELPPPAWPDRDLDDLFRIALRRVFIATANHAVVASLAGKF